jgi:adenine-specific DNA methylase
MVSRDRLVDVMGVYKSWLKRYVAAPKTGRAHEALRQDYREALKNLKGKVKIVYADPPYTRDHYSRYYHVLETMCLRDNPKISTVRENGKDSKSRGIYRLDRHQSPFCIYSEAPSAFAALIAGVRSFDVPLVLSYSPYEKDNGSRPRLMTIKQIEDLAKSHFKRVEIHRAGRIAHSKLTSSENTVGISYNAEILFICEP